MLISAFNFPITNRIQLSTPKRNVSNCVAQRVSLGSGHDTLLRVLRVITTYHFSGGSEPLVTIFQVWSFENEIPDPPYLNTNETIKTKSLVNI